MSMPTDLSGQV